MGANEIVKLIQNLEWKSTNPHLLVWAFLKMGQEYSESVRIALKTYPENILVKKLASEELNTDNLKYLDYNRIGDHWKFLKYFFDKSAPIVIPVNLAKALERGEKVVNDMANKQRCMTVFIREKRGSGIFQAILKAHNWEDAGLGYFKYYLGRHIELDSEDGGHGELADIFKIDTEIAKKFYQSRLDIYKSCIINS